MQAEKGGYASWAWWSILQGRDLLKKGLRWNPFRGNLVRIWADPWVPCLPNFVILSPRPHGCQDEFVEDLLLPNSKLWNFQKLQPYFTSQERDAILQIYLGAGHIQDHLIWHYHKQRIFRILVSIDPRS